MVYICNNMNFTRKLLLPILPVLLLTTCRKTSDANWDLDAVVPVVNSVLNVKNFVPDTLFSADQKGLLHLKLNRELASLMLDSLVSLPAKTDTATFRNPVPLDNVINPGVPFNFPIDPLVFDLGDGIALKTIVIREGKIKVKFYNDLSQPLDLTYELPTVKKNGQVFRISETIPPKPQALIKSYDISGYTFDLTANKNSSNTLLQTYTLMVSPSASPVLLKYNEGAMVELTYEKAVAQFVEGFFGQQKVDIAQDTTDLSFLSNVSTSSFMFSDATMDFSLLNEFGVDFKGNLKNIRAINSRSKQSVTLNSNQLSNINIDRATRAGYDVTGKTKLFSFNSSNSNIVPFISTLPDQISYEGNVLMNPLPENGGNVSGYKDFAVYNKGVRLFANIDIPMKFRADYLELETLSNIEFAKNKVLDGVNDGRFVVYATNGFPFSARLQAYLLDDNLQVMDSVFISGQNTIQAGTLNAQYEVTEPLKSTLYIPVSKEKLDKLTRCRKIRIISRLLMPPNLPEIGIYEKYEIDINITAEVNYNVSLSR